jgi:hypothetical protein
MIEQSPTQPLQQSMPGEGSADERAKMGEWGPIIELVNVPVHAHVLPNGKVLYWGRRVDLVEGDLHPHECKPLVWDPSKPIEENENPKETPQPTRPKVNSTESEKVNLFCSGHAFLPDGRLLVAGGHDGADGAGLSQACIYNYLENTWTALPSMNGGRWYPTVTTLADGTLLVSSGSFSDANGSSVNVVPQIWDEQHGGWNKVDVHYVFPLFPSMHVAPDGQVFMSGSNKDTWLLDTGKTGVDAWSACGTRHSGFRDYAPSVMYDAGKIIYIGGGLNADDGKPTNITEIIDLNPTDPPSVPKWKKTNPMKFRRRQHNATILADGTVLVTGGTQGGGKLWQEGFNDIRDMDYFEGREKAPVREAELWDPATGTWATLAAEAVDRCYHSTAVLLPDATVLSAGGGEYEDPNWKKRDEFNYPTGQVFRPPYLCRGKRPTITLDPEQKKYPITYGGSINLKVSEELEIEKVTWIRLSSVTHTNNQNQRINFLKFDQKGEDLTVTAPKEPQICPPGHYMLFAISKREAGGVPSTAEIIQIVSPPSAMSPVPAEADRDTGLAATTYIGKLDEAVRARSAGTRVTVGLTPHCLYGLGACWAGAHAALTTLTGVAEVRPIANAEDSTGEVYLSDEGLPDLDRWPEEFARAANGSYDFRGVEVTITGTAQQHNGILNLTAPSLDHPVALKPLVSGVKVQWDSDTGEARPVTDSELASYQEVEARYRDRTGEAEQIRVTGPLTKTDTEWILYVRVVEPVEP